MSSNEIDFEFISSVAAAADLCLKPWKYSVILVEKDFRPQSSTSDVQQDSFIGVDLTLRIECRDIDGNRIENNDIDVEIYWSGQEVTIMLGWCNREHLPLLWQGKHSFWMDTKNGSKCLAPQHGENLEHLARRIRALIHIARDD